MILFHLPLKVIVDFTLLKFDFFCYNFVYFILEQDLDTCTSYISKLFQVEVLDVCCIFVLGSINMLPSMIMFS